MIVLCFKIEKKAKPAEALRELYRTIPTGMLNEPIELPRLDRKQFPDGIVTKNFAGIENTPTRDEGRAVRASQALLA
jgi:hypothetical protein